MSESISMQDYFDVTIEYLRNQPTKAMDNYGSCVYLTEDGNKCAVGFHIPDGHPGVSCEGDLYDLADLNPDLKGTAWPEGKDGEKLAYQLQALHDDSGLEWRNVDEPGFTPKGETEIARIAERFGLVYNVPA